VYSKKILDKYLMLDYSITMELSNYSKIFKALSNEQRLKIFMMIYKNYCAPKGSQIGSEFKFKDESCCSIKGGLEKAFTKICDCMNLSRSTISHHFKELQNAGLITCEREGQTYRCMVNEDVVEAVKDFLK
jgi:ArsR family transcriptional regulator